MDKNKWTTLKGSRRTPTNRSVHDRQMNKSLDAGCRDDSLRATRIIEFPNNAVKDKNMFIAIRNLIAGSSPEDETQTSFSKVKILPPVKLLIILVRTTFLQSPTSPAVSTFFFKKSNLYETTFVYSTCSTISIN